MGARAFSFKFCTISAPFPIETFEIAEPKRVHFLYERNAHTEECCCASESDHNEFGTVDQTGVSLFSWRSSLTNARLYQRPNVFERKEFPNWQVKWLCSFFVIFYSFMVRRQNSFSLAFFCGGKKHKKGYRRSKIYHSIKFALFTFIFSLLLLPFFGRNLFVGARFVLLLRRAYDFFCCADPRHLNSQKIKITKTPFALELKRDTNLVLTLQ